MQQIWRPHRASICHEDTAGRHGGYLQKGRSGWVVEGQHAVDCKGVLRFLAEGLAGLWKVRMSSVAKGVLVLLAYGNTGALGTMCSGPVSNGHGQNRCSSWWSKGIFVLWGKCKVPWTHLR